MEYVNQFVQHATIQPGNGHSFRRFREQWKQCRMDYIFLVRPKGEKQRHFLTELFTYLCDCICFEYTNNPDASKASPNSWKVRLYCLYALYVLVSQQPTYEDGSEPVWIPLPEYQWDMIRELCEHIEEHNIKDARAILQFLLQEDCFVFCLERPVEYSTQDANPYPKKGQLFCNGSGSRIFLKPGNLYDMMEIPYVRKTCQEYRRAMGRMMGATKDEPDDDDESSQFLGRFTKVAMEYQGHYNSMMKQWETHRQLNLERALFAQQFRRPAKLSAEQWGEYLHCCEAYDKAASAFHVPKHGGPEWPDPPDDIVPVQNMQRFGLNNDVPDLSRHLPRLRNERMRLPPEETEPKSEFAPQKSVEDTMNAAQSAWDEFADFAGQGASDDASGYDSDSADDDMMERHESTDALTPDDVEILDEEEAVVKTEDSGGRDGPKEEEEEEEDGEESEEEVEAFVEDRALDHVMKGVSLVRAADQHLSRISGGLLGHESGVAEIKFRGKRGQAMREADTKKKKESKTKTRSRRAKKSGQATLADRRRRKNSTRTVFRDVSDDEDEDKGKGNGNEDREESTSRKKRKKDKKKERKKKKERTERKKRKRAIEEKSSKKKDRKRQRLHREAEERAKGPFSLNLPSHHSVELDIPPTLHSGPGSVHSLHFPPMPSFQNPLTLGSAASVGGSSGITHLTGATAQTGFSGLTGMTALTGFSHFGQQYGAYGSYAWPGRMSSARHGYHVANPNNTLYCGGFQLAAPVPMGGHPIQEPTRAQPAPATLPVHETQLSSQSQEPKTEPDATNANEAQVDALEDQLKEESSWDFFDS